MTLGEIADRIGATVAAAGASTGREVTKAFAGDRISDLLSHAGGETLLVTNLNGPQLLRMAEIMDVPGLCLVGGVAPERDVVEAAEANGVVLLVSPHGMYETCGRIYLALEAGGGGAR